MQNIELRIFVRKHSRLEIFINIYTQRRTSVRRRTQQLHENRPANTTHASTHLDIIVPPGTLLVTNTWET